MLSVKQVVEKLKQAGYDYDENDVRNLAQKKRFPNAVKNSQGHWEIPDTDVESQIKKLDDVKVGNESSARNKVTIGAVLATMVTVTLILVNITSVMKAYCDLFPCVSTPTTVPTATLAVTFTPVPLVDTPTYTETPIPPTSTQTETETPMSPTNTQSPTDNPLSLTDSDAIPKVSCGREGVAELQSGLIGSASELVMSGTTRTYAHCPPSPKIQYTDVRVNNELVMVDMNCGDSGAEITSWFSPLVVDGEQLPHYQSEVIDIPEGCHIEFTIRNNLGESIGLDFRAVVPVSATPTPDALSNLTLKLCGKDAFANGTFTTSSPLFLRPDGYTSGWITSDPSQAVMPNGTVQSIPIRYVLVVENLESLQLQNVSIGNIYGCWLRSDISLQIMDEANRELNNMKRDAPNAPSGIFKINENNLVEVVRK